MGPAVPDKAFSGGSASRTAADYGRPARPVSTAATHTDAKKRPRWEPRPSEQDHLRGATVAPFISPVTPEFTSDLVKVAVVRVERVVGFLVVP